MKPAGLSYNRFFLLIIFFQFGMEENIIVPQPFKQALTIPFPTKYPKLHSLN